MRFREEILVVNSPMYHVYTRHVIVAVAIVAGATVVLLPTDCPKEEFLRSLEKYKVFYLLQSEIIMIYHPVNVYACSC